MKRTITPIQYAIYVRKSSDSEDRQVQSLVRQTNDLERVIDRDGLHIACPPFQESQSAFKIGRPVFQELVQKTMSGEISGWVCWHTNRLSRNPVDAGMVIHLMDLGHLKEIRTFSGTYTNSPSHKLLLAFEFGISKNDSEEKSVIVKSGMRRRYERGFPSGHPPVGFMLGLAPTGLEKSYWQVDDLRWPLVRKIFRKFLEGNDSLSTITAFARKIGLQTLDRRNVQGTYLQRSSIHRMLRNPIYAGMFPGAEGTMYPLEKSLPRIVTEDEFEKIGMILGDRYVSSIRESRVYAFSGLIKSPTGDDLGVDPKFHLVCDCYKKFCYLNRERCPYCRADIKKLRRPRYRSYRYYFSKRSKRGVGRWMRAIEDKKIRALLKDHIRKNIHLPKELLRWSLDFIQELQDDVLRDRQREAQNRAQLLKDVEGKRRRLNDLRVDGSISKEDYEERMKEFGELEKESAKADYALPRDWKEEGKKIGDLAEEILLLLEHGEEREINEALAQLGITMVWDGQDLKFVHSETLSRVLALFKKGSVEGRLESMKNCSQVESALQPRSITMSSAAYSDENGGAAQKPGDYENGSFRS